MKKIMITVSGICSSENGEEIRLVLPGEYKTENGNTYISYDETEQTGMEGTRTTVAVEGDCLRLIRSGTTNMALTLEKGIRHESRYETPYGALDIAVTAMETELLLDEEKGRIAARYAIDIANNPTGENVFEISYTAV